MSTIPQYIGDFEQDVNADLDYTFDLNAAGNPYLEVGETISTVEWAASAGITTHNAAHDTTTCTIWVKLGVDGTYYYVTAKVTTSLGRIDERSIRIRFTNM